MIVLLLVTIVKPKKSLPANILVSLMIIRSVLFAFDLEERRFRSDSQEITLYAGQ